MKVTIEVKRTDIIKMLALMDASDGDTQKVLDEVEKCDTLEIDRSTLTDTDKQVPLAVATLVIMQIAKNLNL